MNVQSDAAIVGRRSKDASATEALDACEKEAITVFSTCATRSREIGAVVYSLGLATNQLTMLQ